MKGKEVRGAGHGKEGGVWEMCVDEEGHERYYTWMSPYSVVRRTCMEVDRSEAGEVKLIDWKSDE